MKNTTPLNVHVVISGTSGSVRRCTCACIAHLGRCVHVTAILLHLSDFVKSNGCVVDCLSTSKPCEWNKGKRREKTPSPNVLHKATYSSVKRSQSVLYDFDPRPIEYRNRVGTSLLNNFIINQQQNYAQNFSETPMWLNLSKTHYEDFQIDRYDIDYYFELSNAVCYKYDPRDGSYATLCSCLPDNWNWGTVRMRRLVQASEISNHCFSVQKC